MKKIINVFKQKNMESGYLYFYVHFITEIVCFYCLSKLTSNNYVLWLTPFMYDMFAFVPQALIGYFSDKYPKVNFGLIGIILLIIGFITFVYDLIPGKFIELIILCLGNAFIHISGAEVTLKSSEGKLSHSAIFVSGGSFGVITGKLLGNHDLALIIFLLALTMIPFVLLAEYYKKEIKTKNPCKNYNYADKNINPMAIIILVVIIVMVRGYMGYGIPTSWNKTTFQTILLYTFMGCGKALGGILSDAYGIKKISLISILGAIPFLIFGDKLMIISLIGVMLFSMTMSITLGLLVSVLKDKPGLAFGFTTIGLFLGTIPIFFFKFNSVLSNSILITILSIICVTIMLKVINKENSHE